MSHLELPSSPLLGYEDIQVTTAVKGLVSKDNFINPDTGTPGTVAFVQIQKATVRCRFDGGTPTTSSGIMLSAGEAIRIEGKAALDNARFISDTNQAVTLSVTYFA